GVGRADRLALTRARSYARRGTRQRSLPDGPVLQVELGHREVLGVACSQPGIDADGRGGDQAVRLAEGDAPACVVSAPASCQFALRAAERRETQTSEKARH